MIVGIEIGLAANTATFVKHMEGATRTAKKTAQAIENDLNKAAKSAQDSISKMEQATSRLSDNFEKLKATAAKVGVAIGAITATAGALGGIIQAQREFDVLNASLITATGSADAAASAMAELEKFARDTPFGLSQAVDGFTKLKNLGLTPSIEALTSFGNTAAATGKDLSQMIEAVADASTFEFERLKEFGIIAKQEGNKVAFTFQGVTKSIGKNAKEIEKYLTDLGNNQFASAMAERMNTLDGQLASLADDWNKFLRDVGNYKFAGVSILDAVGAAVQAMSATFAWASDNLHTVFTVLGVAIAVFAKSAIASAASLASGWVGGLATATKANVAYAFSLERTGDILWDLLMGHTPAQMAMHKYKTAVVDATKSTKSFIAANILNTEKIKSKSSALLTATKNTLTLSAAKRALSGSLSATTRGVSALGSSLQRLAIGGLVGASRGVVGIGTALSSLGRIIRTHPIMIIGGVIFALVSRAMGLKNAMQSLSDAIEVVGIVLGDLVDLAIDGFGSMLDTASRFFSGFLGKSNDTTNKVSGYFGDLFKGTKGGFVGLLQVLASLFDKWSGYVLGTLKTIYQNMRVLWNGIARGFVNAFNGINKSLVWLINGVIDMINPVLSFINILAKLNGGSEINLNIRKRVATEIIVAPVEAAASWSDNVENSRLNLRGLVDAAADAQEASKRASKSSDAMASSGDKAAKALGGTGKAGKDATKATNATTDAMKELAKAVDDYRKNLDKALHDLNKPRGLEIEKLDYEREHGSLRGISGNDYAALYGKAYQVDIQGLSNDLDQALYSAHSYGEGAFNQLMDRITNPMDKMSLLLDGDLFNGQGDSLLSKLNSINTASKQYQLLQKAATAQQIQMTQELYKQQDELEAQLELMSASNDYVKTKLENQQAYNKVLAQAEMMDRLGFVSEYESIRSQAETNKLLLDKLATSQAYKSLLSEMTSEEDKQLAAAKERYQIYADMSALHLADGVALDFGLASLDRDLGLNQQPNQNPFGQLDSEHQAKLDQLDAWHEIMQDKHKENADVLLMIEQQYQERSLALKQQHQEAQFKLSMTTGSQMADSMADFAKSAFGEQSKAYRAAFALQKGFAIAQAAIDLQQSISKAMAVGFPANIPLIGQAIAQGAKIAQTIRSIRAPVVGQAHDGIMSVPKSGTWNLEKGERVLPKHTAKAMDKKLETIGTGGNTINVTVNVAEQGNSQTQGNDQFGRKLADGIKATVLDVIRQERRQGGVLYGT